MASDFRPHLVMNPAEATAERTEQMIDASGLLAEQRGGAVGASLHGSWGWDQSQGFVSWHDVEFIGTGKRNRRSTLLRRTVHLQLSI